MTVTGSGKIVTFYSYKGGTGRSMLLANMAWILASAGKRVLVIDWDLEAPGLHRYFHPFLADPDLTSTEGLIDFFTDYMVQALTPKGITAIGEATPTSQVTETSADIARYGVSLDYRFFAPGGSIDFVPAGQQGPAYASGVNSFDWSSFYGRLGGGPFLERVKASMRANYHYVLIDSRTGVSDTSGICTVEMPDALVVCFTLNTQGIEGAGAVTESILAQRPLDVFPVPCRIELAEKDKLEQKRDHYRRRFAGLPSKLDAAEREAYWGKVEVLYQPYYAYEEVLATFADRPNQPTSLLAAVERITGFVTGGVIERADPPPPAERARVAARFAHLAPAQAEQRTAAELERVLAETERRVEELASAQPPRPRPRRTSRVASVVAAALVIIAFAIVTYFLLRNPDPSSTVEPGPLQQSTARVPPIGEPAEVSFGDVSSATALDRTVTIINADPSFALAISVRVDGSDEFVVESSTCRGSLVGGGRCTIQVRFTPVNDGGADARAATLIVDHDAGAPLAIPLTGSRVTVQISG